MMMPDYVQCHRILQTQPIGKLLIQSISKVTKLKLYGLVRIQKAEKKCARVRERKRERESESESVKCEGNEKGWL